MQFFKKDASVTWQILIDKGSTFTAQVIKELIWASGIRIEHATVTKAQTKGMIERSNEKLN